MQNALNRWSWLAVLAVGSLASGCTVEVVNGGSDAGGASPGGDAGVDAAAGEASPLGDSATAEASAEAANDSALDAPDAGDGNVCYAEDDVVEAGSLDPDAAPVDGSDACAALPYYGDACTETVDGGPVNVDAYGVQVCRRFQRELKAAAFAELFACLKDIPPGAENCRTNQGTACVDRVFARTTCAVPTEPRDGGNVGCAEVVASCAASAAVDGGDAASADSGSSVAGLTMVACQQALHPFNAEVRGLVLDCYFDPANASVPCAQRFYDDCVWGDSDIRP